MTFLATTDIPAGTSAASKASIAGMIRDATSIKSVADATARAQAVTDWPTATGAAISAANPVIVYRQDTDRLQISEDGTTWSEFRPSSGQAIVTGKDTCTAPSTTMQSTSTISFGITFASAPEVICQSDIDPAGIITVATGVSTTTTGFAIRYKTVTGTPGDRSISWMAVGLVA